MTLPSPVLVASGCAGFGRELAGFVDLAALGAVVTPSLGGTRGRVLPAILEVGGGLLHGHGSWTTPAHGAQAGLRVIEEHGGRAVVSLAAGHTDDVLASMRAVAGSECVIAFELDLARPSADSRGLPVAADAVVAARLVGAGRRGAEGRPVWVKLPPDLTDVVHTARACADAGADGFVATGPLRGLAFDATAPSPVPGDGQGWLSGPPLRPVALRHVWQLRRAFPHLPTIGNGGIMSGHDALQYLLAGAAAVEVGTAVLADPSAPSRIAAELGDELDRLGHPSVAAVLGLAQLAPVRPGNSGGSR